MGTLETNELLNDARLVVDYATRAGRLPDNALPKAITAVEQAPASGPKIASLYAALNNTVRTIAPMTLVDLRAGRSPFDPNNQKVTRWLQIFLCIFAIGLIGAVAHGTLLLYQEDTALKAIQQVQDSHPLDKLNAVRKMAQYDLVFERPDSHYDEYHRAVGELKDLQDKILSSAQLATSATEIASWLFALFFEVNDGGGSPEHSNASVEPTPSAKTPIGSAAAAEAPKGAAAIPQDKEEPDACDPKNTANDSNSSPQWLQDATEDSIGAYCFAKKLGVDSLFSYLSWFAYQIQARMALLNGWILPFLYGLLGASVFLMRSLLDPTTPNVGFFPALLRLALGGIAGIIIGWVWVPAASKTADIAAITAVPFGLAFLTGFSIDILFSLLDRLNRMVTDALVQTSHRGAQAHAHV